MVNVVVARSSVVVSNSVEVVSSNVGSWGFSVVIEPGSFDSVVVLDSFSVVFGGLVGHGGEQSFDLQEHFGQGTPKIFAWVTLLGVLKSTWNVYPFSVN